VVYDTIKRVILISVDCLRTDFVSCFNGKSGFTPHIDKLAKNSTIFTKAFANGPGTNQSFPSILTSTYFFMHGGLRLLPHYTTLAEVLKENRFKTVAFHSNPFLSKSLGFSKGFNEFYDFLNVIKSPSAFVTQKNSINNNLFRLISTVLGVKCLPWIQKQLKKFYYQFSEFQMPYLEGKELNKYVKKWIQENKADKFFLWMHYMEPHEPFIPPEKYLSNFSSREEAFNYNSNMDYEKSSKEDLKLLRNLYLGEVKYVDECIGDFLRYLDTDGLLDNTLILLLADHGQAFMEHNRFGHMYDILYNEVLHVPLIIYGLKNLKKVGIPVQLLDVPPTILDLLNIEKPLSFLGESLLNITKGGQASAPIFSESAKADLINLKYDLTKKAISCIITPYKLILNQIQGKVELYDIEKDFKEKKNLINDNKDIYKEISTLIQKHLINVTLKKKDLRIEKIS